MRNFVLSLCGGLMLSVAVPVAAAPTVDARLLEMLKGNGAITAAQFDELSADLAKEQRLSAR